MRSKGERELGVSELIHPVDALIEGRGAHRRASHRRVLGSDTARSMVLVRDRITGRRRCQTLVACAAVGRAALRCTSRDPRADDPTGVGDVPGFGSG
jgi:hypothetical protein